MTSAVEVGAETGSPPHPTPVERRLQIRTVRRRTNPYPARPATVRATREALALPVASGGGGSHRVPNAVWDPIVVLGQ